MMKRQEQAKTVNLADVLDQSRKLLSECRTQMGVLRREFTENQVGFVETGAIISRVNKFLEDTNKLKIVSPKKCIISNMHWSWVMDVDGEKILFSSSSNAEYFRDLYMGLGYDVEFNGEPPADKQ